MANTPILHSHAKGIHPGAFVQPTRPDTSSVQDGVLWVDTSSEPPYLLMVWQASTQTWVHLQMDATGYPLPAGHRLEQA